MNQILCPLYEMALFLSSHKSVHFSCINSPRLGIDSSRIPCLCAWKRITSVRITQKVHFIFCCCFYHSVRDLVCSKSWDLLKSQKQADWATAGIGLLQNALPHPLLSVKSKSKQRNRRGWTMGHLSKVTMATISEPASYVWKSKEIQPPSDWEWEFCLLHLHTRQIQDSHL